MTMTTLLERTIIQYNSAQMCETISYQWFCCSHTLTLSTRRTEHKVSVVLSEHSTDFSSD